MLSAVILPGGQINIFSKKQSQKIVAKSVPVKISDNGLFVCKAVNGFGSNSVKIQLVVHGKQPRTKFLPEKWNLKIYHYI